MESNKTPTLSHKSQKAHPKTKPQAPNPTPLNSKPKLLNPKPVTTRASELGVAKCTRGGGADPLGGALERRRT